MAVIGDFVFPTLGFFLGMVLFVKGTHWMRRERFIENIPTSKARSVAMGLVELFGRVECANFKLLRSPLTDQKCVYYRCEVSEDSGRNDTKDKILASEKRGIHFYLNDETGRVLVDPEGARVDIKKNFHLRKLSRYPRQAAFLIETMGLNSTPEDILSKNITVLEEYILPFDKCYVIGEAVDNPHLERGTGRKNEDSIMIRAPSSNANYTISDRSEKEILKFLRKWTKIGMVGGPALSASCLALILFYLGTM